MYPLDSIGKIMEWEFFLFGYAPEDPAGEQYGTYNSARGRFRWRDCSLDRDHDSISYTGIPLGCIRTNLETGEIEFKFDDSIKGL